MSVHAKRNEQRLFSTCESGHYPPYGDIPYRRCELVIRSRYDTSYATTLHLHQHIPRRTPHYSTLHRYSHTRLIFWNPADAIAMELHTPFQTTF